MEEQHWATWWCEWASNLLTIQVRTVKTEGQISADVGRDQATAAALEQ